jgi:transcriptional regulator with XRE-family HTH domain
MVAEKLKHARTQKGFSQEKLATESGLSLRTVQRVENAETDPQGDTLRRLALALDMTPDELQEGSQKEDVSYLRNLNISGFSSLLFPLVGVVVPWILWLGKKDEIKKVNTVGKKVINFQLTWGITYFVYVIGYNILFHHFNYVRVDNSVEDMFNTVPDEYQTIGVILFALLYLYNIIITGLNVYFSTQDNEQWYHPQIPFMT